MLDCTVPERPPNQGDWCDDAEVHHSHHDGGRDPRDRVRELHPGALDWTEMSRHEQSRKHERTGKNTEDIGDEDPLTPPGERGEHEEGSTDGKTKPSTFTSRQSSWYVCRHSSDSGIAGCSFL